MPRFLAVIIDSQLSEEALEMCALGVCALGVCAEGSAVASAESFRQLLWRGTGHWDGGF